MEVRPVIVSKVNRKLEFFITHEQTFISKLQHNSDTNINKHTQNNGEMSAMWK